MFEYGDMCEEMGTDIEAIPFPLASTIESLFEASSFSRNYLSKFREKITYRSMYYVRIKTVRFGGVDNEIITDELIRDLFSFPLSRSIPINN